MRLVSFVVVVSAAISISHAYTLPPLPIVDRIIRSDWTNVANCGARGDGVHDDTTAFQHGLDILAANGNGAIGNLTLYIPAGTYLLTATLKINNTNGIAILGVGRDTILRWAGPMDAAARMIWSSGNTRDMFEGFMLDGAGRAGVGIDHDTHWSYYETREIHRHLALVNFVTAGVRVGFDTTNNNAPSAEMLFVNCIFANSTAGVSLLSWNDCE